MGTAEHLLCLLRKVHYQLEANEGLCSINMHVCLVQHVCILNKVVNLAFLGFCIFIFRPKYNE